MGNENHTTHGITHKVLLENQKHQYNTLEKSLPFKKHFYHRFVRKLRDLLTFVKILRHSRDDLVQV